MTTPLKGLFSVFSVILKLPSLPVKNPNWQKAHQLAIYKAWRICPWDHRGQIHSLVRIGDLNPGLRIPFPNSDH